jgi:hypothetical protein
LYFAIKNKVIVLKEEKQLGEVSDMVSSKVKNTLEETQKNKEIPKREKDQETSE